jgi:LytS/YehU family sensor histidine kinase
MALHHSEKSLITLEDELETLRLYLDLERLRFKNAFNYSITFINSVDSALVYIPPLLIQPFAENAIWHGLMHKQGPGYLDIELSMVKEVLTCVITDNGIGRTKAAYLNHNKTGTRNKGMGVQITVDRLALFNRTGNDKSVFDIEDITDEAGNPGGTRVTLNIKYQDVTKTPELQHQ